MGLDKIECFEDIPNGRYSLRGLKCVPRKGQDFYSTMFLVSKKDGTLRPVINLRNLNQFIRASHFKTDGIQSVRDILQESDWLLEALGFFPNLS